MTQQPQPADWLGWRQLLNLGEQLMAAPAVGAQIKLILETAAHLLRGQSDVWLADIFYGLPRLTELPSFSSLPPSESMRSAVETGRVRPDDATKTEPGPFVAAAPLMVNGILLGALQVKRLAGPAFSELEIEILRGLALQSAIALHATLQVEIERWRVEQLALVRKVSGQVANVLDLNELFERVAELILDTFKYYYVALFTIEPSSDTLRFWASAGPTNAESEVEKHFKGVLQVRLGDGIIGHVAQTGEEILASDVSCEPRYWYEDALPETRSEVALPLKIENRILGVLDVQSDQPDDFDDTDMLVLRALAHNISIAVEDARLYGDLERRADQLAIVGEVTRAVASILDLDVLMEEVATLIQRRFSYPFVHLFTVHPGRRQVIYRAGSGSRSQLLQDQELTYDLDDPVGIVPWVARHGETALADDVKRDPRYRPSELPSPDTCAELAIPLIFGGQVLGVLDVQSNRQNAFGDEDRVLLEALADNVAIAIRNANLYRSELWRRQVADSLREVAGLLSADVAVDQVLDAILTELEHTLSCDVAAIWLLQNDVPSMPDRQLRLAAVRGFTDIEISSVEDLPPGTDSWLDRALNAEEPTVWDSGTSAEPLGVMLGLSPAYSAIAAPLRAGDRRLGLLTLVHRVPGRYGSESQAMTSAFASYAAVAIENARLYETAQEQAWISTVLLKVAEATQSLTTLDQVLESVVRLLPMLVGVDRCALLFSSQEEENQGEAVQTFVPAVAYGFTPTQRAFFDKWRIARGEVPALDHACLVKSPVFVRDAIHDPRVPGYVPSALGLDALLILPLLAHGEVLGAMLVDIHSDRTEFEEERLAMLQGIAHQTAAAIENARLLETRQEEAYVSAALLQVAQAVASFNELDDILGAIVRIAPMVVGVEWCIIFLWEKTQGTYRPAQAYGLSRSAEAALHAQRFASGEFPLLDATRDSQSLVTVDGLSDWDDLIPTRYSDDFVAWLQSAISSRTAYQAKAETHSMFALPLSVKADVLGVMLMEESVPSSRFRARRLEIITGIAQQAALAIQNDLLKKEMADREQLERELQFAREIQQALIPSQLPRMHGWELAFTWRAARQVAGDFYDFFELPRGRLGLVIADVADKGMPAALFMALTRALLRAAALEDDTPGDVLERVNKLLLPDAQHGMFVTAVYAVLSLDTGELAYSVAGHNLPLLWRYRTQELVQFGRGGIALGVLDEITLKDRKESLEPGDQVIFYTDGITEAFSSENDVYGEERLWMTVRANGGNSARAMLEAIDESVVAFVGDHPPSDDITLMVLRRQVA